MTQLIFADLVQETTRTTGTGPLALDGATKGNRRFADAVSAGQSFYYSLSGAPAAPTMFEVGTGTMRSDGRIDRAPSASSAGGAAVALPAGTKTVTLTAAAEFFATVTAHDAFAAWSQQPGNSGKSLADFLAAIVTPDSVVAHDAYAAWLAQAGNAGRSFDDFLGIVTNATADQYALSTPTLVSNNFVRTMLVSPAPSLIGSDGGDDGVTSSLKISGGRFTQGPTGHLSYYDTVIALGHNLSASFTPANPTMPSCSYRIESKFASGGAAFPFCAEFHIASLFPVDAPNTEARAASVTIPHKTSDWDTSFFSMGMRAASWGFFDGLGRQRMGWDWRSGSGTIDMLDGGSGDGHPVLRFNTNNKPCLRQLNAAGNAYDALPYIDAHGVLLVEQPIYMAPARRVNANGNAAGIELLMSNARANDVGLAISSGGFTGDYSPFKFFGNNVGNYCGQIYNSAGKSLIEFQSLGSLCDGDTTISMSNVIDGQIWSIGMDVSDGGKLKIEPSYRGVGLHTPAIEFNPAGYARFPVAPVKPMMTVAQLNALATKVTGMEALASDGRRAGEAAGAGTGCPAWYDGTAWRTFYDNSAVAA